MRCTIIKLTKSDVQFMIGALNCAADEYAKAIETVQESGLKRIYGMQLERNQHLVSVLEKALETNAKRISID